MARTEIAGFRPQAYKTLQAKARKTILFHREINDMRIVQGELNTPIGKVNARFVKCVDID